jgi:hypothetical protein
MNYTKIDPTLVYELKERKYQSFSVFLDVDNNIFSSENKEQLTNMGIDISDNKAHIFTANLSVEQIESLSNEPWIRYISKGKTMKYKFSNEKF